VNGALPPEHPDDDLLADLAADVLPTHQARVVEAHVMACARCSGVLTDAERVRNLLLSDDPGPIPPDVLARIDQALQIEAAARDGMGDHPAPTAPNPVTGHAPPPEQPPRQTPPVRVISPWEDTTTIQAFEAARKRQAVTRKRPAETSPGPATTTSGIAAPRSRGPRLTRPSRGPSRSRREMRDEVRDVKAGRRGMVLAGAAGVVVLLGLGGYVVVALLGNHEATTATTAASSGDSAPKALGAGAAGTGTPVLVTGTNYTDTALGQQAKVLVGSAVRPAAGRAGMAPQSGTVRSAVAESPGPAAADAAASGNGALRNPATLAGCLSALRAGGRRPVAVDLARYEGRDAAVIVLNGVNGGYEVWVVARDCRPGADGTIKYLDLSQ
jgi:hypothetical protein